MISFSKSKKAGVKVSGPVQPSPGSRLPQLLCRVAQVPGTYGFQGLGLRVGFRGVRLMQGVGFRVWAWGSAFSSLLKGRFGCS